MRQEEIIMESTAGIFATRARAEQAVERVRALGIAGDRIVYLTPHDAADIEADLPTTDAEPTGIGQALGGTVGGAMGAAGGASLGAAAASLMVPGVGPVLAAGILGAAVLGIGGAVTGAALGGVAEEGLEDGLPHDELFVYEDALRKGKSVVIVFVEEGESADRVRQIIAQAGAETIDAAREDWWLGLRDGEEEYYRTQGRDLGRDEVNYRRGFEAALNSKFRGRKFEDAAPDLGTHYSETGTADDFRHGYERGYAYCERYIARAEGAKRATKASG